MKSVGKKRKECVTSAHRVETRSDEAQGKYGRRGKKTQTDQARTVRRGCRKGRCVSSDVAGYRSHGDSEAMIS